MMYWRRPLTRLEAALYGCLLAVFVGVFARSMAGYMEAAERLAMQATLINTTAAINVRRFQGLSDWQRRNPFELSGATPPNFVKGGDPASMESGQWTFDIEQAELVYLPRLRLTLQTSDGQNVLRFRLIQGPRGYSLEPKAPFVWG
jgi:hypothetical protein